jgi:hypothetical protein
MKPKYFPQEQIVKILEEAEAGTEPNADLAGLASKRSAGPSASLPLIGGFAELALHEPFIDGGELKDERDRVTA